MIIKRKPLSIEHRQKLSKSHKGKNPWNKGLLGYRKGHTVSPEARIKIGNATRGKTPWSKGKKLSPETCKKISESRKGIKFSEQHIKRLSESHKGEKSYRWRGGITSVNQKIRSSKEYQLWRIAVFQRDNFCCVWCGVSGKWNKNTKSRAIIHADHIKPFAYFPELRFAIDNGRTLCIDCHKTTDTFGVSKNHE